MQKKRFSLHWSHVVAAFMGIVIAAYLQAHDPELAKTNRVAAVLWTSLMFGAVWELARRAFTDRKLAIELALALAALAGLMWWTTI